MSGFRYGMIATVLLFSACFLLGCTGGSSLSDLLPGNGPKTVGTDVKMRPKRISLSPVQRSFHRQNGNNFLII